MMRSKGLTVLCVLMCLLAIAGLGDSIVILTGQIELLPSWLGYFTLMFGITAGGVAAGLWRVKRWGLYSLRAWVVACFMLLFSLAYVFKSAIDGRITAVAIIALFLAGLFFVLDRYVSSKTDRAA
jgi:hypothetical protein